MSWQRCIEEMQRAAGRELTDQEITDLQTELQRRAERLRVRDDADDLNQAVIKAADEYAEEMAEAALVQKRNAAMNLRRRLDAIDYVTNTFGDNWIQGLEALMVGTPRPLPGAKRSVGALQNRYTRKYLAGLVADLSRNDNLRLFTSGAMDREVARAMWARNRDEAFPVDVPKEAIEIADVLTKWQEAARQDANRSGAWIKRMPGYIVRQSHDMYRIRRAGFDTWRETIENRLDWDRIRQEHGEVDPSAFLREVYAGLASGVHLKTAEQPGFTGPRNIAKKMSAERVLHFKSADDWMDYNNAFGTRSLSSAFIRGLELNAQNVGLMRVFGTNPEANLNQIVRELQGRTQDPALRENLQKALDGRIGNQLAVLDGTTRVPVNKAGARFGSIFRAIENMSKLGGAVLSQFSDLPLAGLTMRYQGQNLFEAMGEGLTSIGRGLGPAERRELYGSLEVVFDSVRGDAVMSRHSAAIDDLPGGVARLQQLFFKLNFMLPWTDRLRAGMIDGMSRRLAMNRSAEFSGLKPDLQRVLSMYGIDETQWGIIRQGSTRQVDGREYITRDGVMDLPDEAFSPLVEARGRKVTQARLREAREEVAENLGMYYTDQGDMAVSIPDAKTRAFMQQGTRPGTVSGELLRFIGQFKSFPTGVVMMHIRRELFGRGADSLREALRNGNGELVGLAQLMVFSALFGYVAMSAKDLAKGRGPRDPSERDTWLAAMVQGGGAGIYGDFLFGELRTRFGGGPVSAFMGPAAGTVEGFLDLAGRVRDGDDIAAQSLRRVISAAPFANLFYTRSVLDYLFMYRVMESLNPGYLRRMERRVERENEQQFLIRPSEVAR